MTDCFPPSSANPALDWGWGSRSGPRQRPGGGGGPHSPLRQTQGSLFCLMGLFSVLRVFPQIRPTSLLGANSTSVDSAWAHGQCARRPLTVLRVQPPGTPVPTLSTPGTGVASGQLSGAGTPCA